MNLPFLLFHWSPASRRKSIIRNGLCPGKISRCGQWHPPYLCFSKSPSQAWALSGARDTCPGEWDLWMVWSNVLPTGYMGEKEFRSYERIPKRDVWFVGSRIHTPRGKP